jgi:hypothetical protein
MDLRESLQNPAERRPPLRDDQSSKTGAPQMQITFNTSRLYVARGQIITAQHLEEEELVRFADHSRMIYGEFSIATYAVEFRGWPGLFAACVMEHYDRGDYRMSLEAMNLAESETVHSFQL